MFSMTKGEGVQRGDGRRRRLCVCLWLREHWGMGCLYNEVRRGLVLTKEERGGSPEFKLCQQQKTKLGDVHPGCVH